MLKYVNSLLVEAFGVFSLCFVGGLAVMSNTNPNPLNKFFDSNLIGVGFAHAIILGFCICLGGPISGGQFNPAVTCALMLTRDLEIIKGCLYLGAQCAGSLLAGFLLLFAKSPSYKGKDLGYPHYSAATGSQLTGFFMEFTATFFLVLAVYTGIRTKRSEIVIGTWVGGILLCMIQVIGPRTGASLNPCRTLGPALFSGAFTRHKGNWLYYAGPLAGGAAAGLLSTFVFHSGNKGQQEVKELAEEDNVEAL